MNAKGSLLSDMGRIAASEIKASGARNAEAFLIMEVVYLIQIYLGAEGEYGRRLARFLLGHLDRSYRLKHYTRPDQWQASSDISAAALSVMNPAFFQNLAGEVQEEIREKGILWISDTEEEGAYCRYHPPADLVRMIMERTGGSETAGAVKGKGRGGPEIIAFYSPLAGTGPYRSIMKRMQAGDLYLGMADLAVENPEAMTEGNGRRADGIGRFGRADEAGRFSITDGIGRFSNADETGRFSITDGIGRFSNTDEAGSPDHMGDLCYYIGLREDRILQRIEELSLHQGEYSLLPSPPAVLPLLELSEEDYGWFFTRLRSGNGYKHIYLNLGSGILARAGILSALDRLFLLGSRQNRKAVLACEHILKSLQAGYGGFSGECRMIYAD